MLEMYDVLFFLFSSRCLFDARLLLHYFLVFHNTRCLFDIKNLLLQYFCITFIIIIIIIIIIVMLFIHLVCFC